VRSALRLGLLTCQPFGSQPFLVGIKRLLRRFVLAHGFFGFDTACRIARLPLLGGQGLAPVGNIFRHGETTRTSGKSSAWSRWAARRVDCIICENNPMHSSQVLLRKELFYRADGAFDPAGISMSAITGKWSEYALAPSSVQTFPIRLSDVA
jgi:hypothetical protein